MNTRILMIEDVSPLVCADETPATEALLCFSFDGIGAATDEIMYMPAGKHSIVPSQAGRGVSVNVLVDASGASAMEQQRQAILAKTGKRPYFDFNHDDQEASFWPTQFFWKDGKDAGIYAKGEWSKDGKEGVEGKMWRGFSPIFYVDNTAANPARIVCRENAKPNFGGLVNNPAFNRILPFWAKAADEADAGESINMKKTLAELQAELKDMQKDITALKAKASAETGDALVAKQNEIKLAEAEARGLELQIENEKLSAKNSSLEGVATARLKKLATDTVAAAVQAGKIPAKDEALQAKYRGLIEQDETNVVLVASLPENPALSAKSSTQGQRIIVQEGMANIVKAYGELAAKNSGIRDLSPVGMKEKGRLAMEMAAIFAKEISGKPEFLDMPLVAADNSDANLGILSGTLVAQRVLEYFQYEFPVLSAITTDFSDSPAQFGQTETTRIVVTPAVQEYSAAAGADGRPQGWATVVAAQTTDVPITLDKHVGVPIVFDSNQLASTSRRLFDEQAPAASYALAKYFVDKIYALFTAANYNGYAAVVAGKVPVAYATYKKGLADISRTSLTDVQAAFNQNEVPMANRFLLLNSQYYAKLSADPSLVTFFAGQQAPEMITEGRLPRMAGFQPIEAPNFPGANNGFGMFLHKAGVVVKSRLSNDYTQALPGASYGNVTTVTNPKIGISVALVQYVNHTGGYAEWRIQVMLGAAKGDKRGGLLGVSQ